MTKRFFLFLLINWILCEYAMEDKEKGMIPFGSESESCIQSLLDSFNQLTWSEQDRKTLARIGYSEEVQVERYPEIGFEIVKDFALSFEQKRLILSRLSWKPELDSDTKKVLKLLRGYCFHPEAYNKEIREEFSDADQWTMQEFNLSWRALLDIESDVPCKFLLRQEKLRIPKKIVHELIEMGDFPKHHKFIDSPEQAKQILKRLHFVLERGASVTIPLSNKSKSQTPLEYVQTIIPHLQKCLDSKGSHFSAYKLHPEMLDLHLLYFKNMLTLFVEYLNKNEDSVLEK